MKLTDSQFKGLLSAYKKTYSEKVDSAVPEGFASSAMLRIRRESARAEDVEHNTSILLLWRMALGSSAFSAVAAILVLQISSTLESGIVEALISQGL